MPKIQELWIVTIAVHDVCFTLGIALQSWAMPCVTGLWFTVVLYGDPTTEFLLNDFEKSSVKPFIFEKLASRKGAALFHILVFKHW